MYTKLQLMTIFYIWILMEQLHLMHMVTWDHAREHLFAKVQQEDYLVIWKDQP